MFDEEPVAAMTENLVENIKGKKSRKKKKVE
jgi:hypothetical protein